MYSKHFANLSITSHGKHNVVVLKSNVAHNDNQMNSRNSFSPINLSPSKFVHLESNKSDSGSLVKTFDYIK